MAMKLVIVAICDEFYRYYETKDKDENTSGKIWEIDM